MHVPDLNREKVESILHRQGQAQLNRQCMCLKQGLRRANLFCVGEAKPGLNRSVCSSWGLSRAIAIQRAQGYARLNRVSSGACQQFVRALAVRVMEPGVL